MRTLARWCARHWIITIVGWIAVVVVLVGLHSAAGSAYTDKFTLPHTQSSEALKLLQRADPKKSGETDQLTISVDHGKVTDPAVKARAEKLFAQVAKVPHVAEVISPFTAQTAKQIASDGTVAFADVVFDNAANNNKITASQATHFDNVVTSASSGSVQFNVEGNIAEAGNKQNSSSSLFIGFIAAAIVLFLAFGSIVAMFLPLITAGVSLGAGTAVIGLLSHALDIASFSSELALLIGLGVGVDYALFIVTRFRQATLRGVSREDAVVEAIDTSGRAVLFAGMIVVIAMLGMFALGVSFLYGVAVAAAVVVAFTVIAALTLLPALLSG
ncbi:MAG: MMPL family transporter, partial [Solirubrobacteraceae bacterium]